MDVFLLIVLSVSHAIAVSFLKWLVKIKLVLKMHRKKHSVPFRCASPSCFGTEEQVLYECHLTHSHICSHQQLYVCTSIEPRLKLALPACTPRLNVFLCWPANFLFHRVSSVFLWGRQPPRELKHMREIHTQDRADGFSCQSQEKTVWPTENMARIGERKKRGQETFSIHKDGQISFSFKCMGM